MSPKTVLIALAAFLAASFSLKAEQAEESKAEQPYAEQLGDNQVTSVKREITKGVGLSREELLQAAREAAPINVAPSDPTTDPKPNEQQ